MSNDFDFFEGSASRARIPRITVRRGGLIALTPGAVEMLGDNATHVQVGYNTETQAVGLRPAPEDVKGRYRLRHQTSSQSRLVDTRRFFAHHGLTFERATTFDAEDFGDGMVGFYLAEDDQLR
jgi:hypothetical protein